MISHHGFVLIKKGIDRNSTLQAGKLDQTISLLKQQCTRINRFPSMVTLR
jgi:hypothetical protein